MNPLSVKKTYFDLTIFSRDLKKAAEKFMTNQTENGGHCNDDQETSKTGSGNTTKSCDEDDDYRGNVFFDLTKFCDGKPELGCVKTASRQAYNKTGKTASRKTNKKTGCHKTEDTNSGKFGVITLTDLTALRNMDKDQIYTTANKKMYKDCKAKVFTGMTRNSIKTRSKGEDESYNENDIKNEDTESVDELERQRLVTSFKYSLVTELEKYSCKCMQNYRNLLIQSLHACASVYNFCTQSKFRHGTHLTTLPTIKEESLRHSISNDRIKVADEKDPENDIVKISDSDDDDGCGISDNLLESAEDDRIAELDESNIKIDKSQTSQEESQIQAKNRKVTHNPNSGDETPDVWRVPENRKPPHLQQTQNTRFCRHIQDKRRNSFEQNIRATSPILTHYIKPKK